jgi:hypothetical protein
VDAKGRLLGVWTPRGLQDSTPGLARCVLSRARLQAVLIVVCWSRQQWILYKDDAHVERQTGIEVVMWMAAAWRYENLDANLHFRNIANRLGSSA